MSFSKKLPKIQGKIEGKTVIAEGDFHVSEQSPNHFIVGTGNSATELFLTSQGLLSDGNSVDGIEVLIESERERIISKHFANDLLTVSSKTKGLVLKAPMPGMVKAVSVAVGDKVQKNSQVLVLEAMKMENSITAGFAGVVSKIYVEAGKSVEKNMPLVEFEHG
jgi:biotin carboxyl carrier protein